MKIINGVLFSQKKKKQNVKLGSKYASVACEG